MKDHILPDEALDLYQEKTNSLVYHDQGSTAIEAPHPPCYLALAEVPSGGDDDDFLEVYTCIVCGRIVRKHNPICGLCMCDRTGQVIEFLNKLLASQDLTELHAKAAELITLLEGLHYAI